MTSPRQAPAAETAERSHLALRAVMDAVTLEEAAEAELRAAVLGLSAG